MPKVRDLSGMKFGRLTVLKFDSLNHLRKAKWDCVCDCGNEVVVLANALVSGRKASCGCYQKENLHNLHFKHGQWNTRMNRIWRGIKARCYSPSSKDYRNYGYRGIQMAENWRKDFLTFREWCLNNGYSEHLTIDRIDVNGDYTPENCRWVTRKTQGNNRRDNRHITFNGETKTMKQWSEELGISYSTLTKRVMNGVPEERLLDKPKEMKAR